MRRWKYLWLAVLAVAAVAVAGFVLTRTPTPPPAAESVLKARPIELPKIPHLLVVGDSYSGGSAIGGNGNDGWPVLAQTEITADGSRLALELQARGGSGYVNIGPEAIAHGDNFGAAYSKALKHDVDVVLIFGSINDRTQSVADVDAAARALYADVRKKSPKAKLIVVGPPWMNDDRPDEIFELRDTIKAAAADAKATFVDPLAAGWFTGKDAKLIGADGTHPTDEGHAYMAAQLAPVIKKALTGASK
jgi:lysophospholipase L1-like esterase